MEFEKARMKECREVLVKKVLGEREYLLKKSSGKIDSSSWFGGKFSLCCNGNSSQCTVDVWNELPPLEALGDKSVPSGEIDPSDRHSGYVIITNHARNNHNYRNAGGNNNIRINDRSRSPIVHSESGSESDDNSGAFRARAMRDRWENTNQDRHIESNNINAREFDNNNAQSNINTQLQLNASHNRLNLLQHQNAFLASRTNVDLPKDSYYCSICMVNLKQTIMYPCGHAVACESCAKKLMEKRRGQELKCPVCRKAVKCPVKFFGVFECDDVLGKGGGEGN